MTRRALALALFVTLSCVSGVRAQPAIELQLIGLNDFHGQLTAGKKLNGRATGGAAVLAAYVRDAAASAPSLIVHAGDWVGASPPDSALLQDEPAIDFLGMLGNRFCTRAQPYHTRCNVVGTPGNHEFDEGVPELLRLLRGGNHRRGPFLGKRWVGARVSYVSANVFDRRTGVTILPPFTIKQVAGVKIGVIGATLEEAPSMVVAAGVSRVRFMPEAQAINRQVRALRKLGVQTIVVTIHQGGPQEPYPGPTREDASGPSEGIADIIAELDDAVDVVISGHAHAFTNALMKNKNGHAILVTQSVFAGQALTRIALSIDPRSKDVVGKSAQVIATYADQAPKVAVDDVNALVEAASAAVAPLAARVIGRASLALDAKLDAAGNSVLGNLIADAQRASVKAQVALMNQGGIRASLDAGEVSWGELFAIQPFGNVVVALDLRGDQILRALEQQWLDPAHEHRLTVSGLSYSWDPAAPPGMRIRGVRIGEHELDRNASYRVAVNNFLSEGGSGFTMFREGKNAHVGPIDLDALLHYIAQLGGQLPDQLEQRATTR
jgi:5'-nucleotidase